MDKEITPVARLYYGEGNLLSYRHRYFYVEDETFYPVDCSWVESAIEWRCVAPGAHGHPQPATKKLVAALAQKSLFCIERYETDEVEFNIYPLTATARSEELPLKNKEEIWLAANFNRSRDTKIEKKFQEFIQTLLDLGADFIICGSVALKAYGLINRSCNDLDILMDCSNPENQKAITILKSLCFEIPEYGYIDGLQPPATQLHVPNIGRLCIFQCSNLDELRNPNEPRFIKSEIAVSDKIKWALKAGREKDRKDALALIV